MSVAFITTESIKPVEKRGRGGACKTPIPEGVKLAIKSANRKIGDAAATWVAQESCPKDCLFYKSGCYAETHWSGQLTRRLASHPHTAVELAHEEARQIIDYADSYILRPKRPLRLHVVGDCATEETAGIVSKAADYYRKITRKPVWTYTHAKNVARKFWGGVSVFRSCHSIEEVKAAHQEDYASVLVVGDFKNGEKAYKEDGFTIIPCPEQTKGIPCTDCRLCFNDRRLHENKAVVAFKLHGLVAEAYSKKLLPDENK